MRTRLITAIVGIAIVSLLAENTFAQLRRPGIMRRPGQQSQGRNQNKNDDKEEKEKVRKLPSDPKLLQIHKEFVTKAEQLATEYERTGDLDKARTVYEEILVLVPKYPAAESKLNAIIMKQAGEKTKRFDVDADRGWQDTGIDFVEGKPITITVGGNWTFNMSYTLGPEGFEIPEGLKDFPLGALMGVVFQPGDEKEDIEPFVVGQRMQFIAKKSGRLLLKMHDSDPTDNEGKLTVEITGSFGEGNKIPGF